MARYEGDEYEDWDEYEEEGEEEEEEGGEDEYEEPHQPTEEELKYLELRQKLKETFRKKMMKESGTANGNSRDKINVNRKDNYGSFFGPSQPIIAARVIQESMSLLENPDLAARLSNKHNRPNDKSSGTNHVKPKPRDNHLPRVSNVLKKKVEILKNTRDYSFLHSDNAEVPAPLKSLPPRNVFAPKTDARPAQQLSRSSNQVANDRGRPPPPLNGQRKPMPSSSSQHKSKPGSERMAHASSKSSVDPRRLLGSNNGSGPGRPAGPKGTMPSRSSVPTSNGRGAPLVARNSTSGVGSQRPPAHLTAQSAPRRPMPSQHLQSGGYKSGLPRGQPSPGLRKPPPVQREYRESSKPKVMTKHALPSFEDQAKRPPPRPAPRHISADQRPKVKPKRRPYDEDSVYDMSAVSNTIRNMFRYNPDKFNDDDDDDDLSNMEVTFDQILREEKRSSKIAKQEDDEQKRLIEIEDEKERMRAKKRKLGH